MSPASVPRRPSRWPCRRPGLLAPAARPVIGELAVADIGVPVEVYDRLGVRVDPLFAERSIVRVMGDG